MVKVFYAPLSYRNTAEFLFKEALKDIQKSDYSGILYLSTNAIKTQETQKTFHRLVAKGFYLPPDIETLMQHCKKLYSVYGEKRILNAALIPVILSKLTDKGLGFSAVAARFISELKQLYPEQDIAAIKMHFSDTLDALNIPESVSKTIMDCLGIFEGYHDFLRDNGLIDEEDLINTCSEYIEEMVKDNGTRGMLILDGFYNPAASEMNVLRGLIRNAENALIAIPYDKQFRGLTEGYINFLKENFFVEEIYLKEGQEAIGNPSPIAHFVYHSYPGIEEEIEGIARKIKSLYVSGKFRNLEEVVVSFPDLKKYSAMAGRIFKRYGIPCDISKRKTLGKMRPFLDLLHLLSSVADGYPRLKFSQFLSSQYFTKIPSRLRKWISSLSVRSGIISGKKAWLDFIEKGSEMVDMSLMNEREAILNDMEWVFEKLRPLEDAKGFAGFDTYANLLRNLLNEFGFMAFPLPDSLTKDIRRITKELLEQVSFLNSLHSNTVSLHEFIDVLNHLLNNSYLETEAAGVRIMDFPALLGLSPQYIFLGGLTDIDIPERPGIDYFLPDSVKKELGFLHLDKYIDIQRFWFQGIIRSAKNLHLSYPAMDGDEMFLPSSFLYSGEEVKERITGIFSKEELLVRQGSKPFSMHISEIEIQPLAFSLQHLHPKKSQDFLGTPSSAFLRVTDVDAYRTCHRRFFIERILNLEPVSVKEYELEAATIGTIIHKIMERLLKEPFDSIENLRQRAEAIIDESMKERRIDAYWKRLIKDTFIEILPDIYERELEIRKDGYISTEVEMTITGEPIKGVRLRGKIDRFDRIDDSVQIIDYKTGTAGLNCKQVLEGNEKLQLFLYAAIMKNQGYKVSRVGIYSLKDIDIKWCPPKKTRRQKTEDRRQTTENIDDYIIASLQFLEEAVKNIRKGDFKAKPLNDYICWNCHEYAFCPYTQQ